ncbi:tetratricopeptide repeat protein [Sphingomonas parva]|uniref:Tetratricopeptide repeat protein n=1 Tax=Sphingomonas parva TaxID=2555898 RepID=A0A4Y8ZTC4_9SPHN|nr:tetratricopeptide repeat protein [Sphingomonas parva]TFI59270.1 tetratricopeptide repeat protein [Sphingomonas parva]
MEEGDALAAYARALAADSFGAQRQAIAGYAAALDLAPDNEVLAARALEEALAAGDQPLAVRAAKVLEARNKLGPDARLVLLADAVRRKDWRAAGLNADRMAEDRVFVFTAPLLHAWIAVGTGKGDPVAPIVAAARDPLATAYGAEQRPLLLIAAGRTKEGLAALAPLIEGKEPRAERLRLAAAALLARKKARKDALALLPEDQPSFARARSLIARGKPLIEGDLAAWGISSFLVRIAADLRGQEVPALAFNLARIATFAAPRNSEAWLATAEMLAGRGQNEAALAALAQVPADDLLGQAAMDRRLSLLVENGNAESALADARAAAEAQPNSPAAWTRLADLFAKLEQHREAADAYGKALQAIAAGAESDTPEWALWLLSGAELSRAGDWERGKTALQRAYTLAPQQPVVLNHLGYSQLERRENLDEAERLIREASKLDPDSAAITDSLGWALYVRGDYSRAIELLERAAKGEPADSAINEHLGDAYYSAGRRYEARYAWQAALIYAEAEAAERLRAKILRGLHPELAAP